MVSAASSRGESNMCYHAHSHLFKFIMGYQFLYVEGYMRRHEGSLVFDLDLDSTSWTDFTPVTLCIFDSVVRHRDAIHSDGRGANTSNPKRTNDTMLDQICLGRQ